MKPWEWDIFEWRWQLHRDMDANGPTNRVSIRKGYKDKASARHAARRAMKGMGLVERKDKDA